MAAGTWRAEPFTKMVRWAWMWKRVCSAVWQLIPSTGWPVAAVPVPASAGPTGTGTPSGPSGPGAGAGLRVPSVLSGARLSLGAVTPAGLGLPPVRASVIPTTAAMIRTAAAPPTSQRRRRLRWASSARNRAIFSRVRCGLSRLLFDTTMGCPRLTAGSGGA